MQIGEVIRLDYTSDKWEGNDVYYYHNFKKNGPMLLKDKKGNLYLDGFIKVTELGIDDWDDIQEYGMIRHPPQAVAKLGILELIMYVDPTTKEAKTLTFGDRYYVGDPNEDWTYISSPLKISIRNPTLRQEIHNVLRKHRLPLDSLRPENPQYNEALDIIKKEGLYGRFKHTGKEENPHPIIPLISYEGAMIVSTLAGGIAGGIIGKEIQRQIDKHFPMKNPAIDPKKIKAEIRKTKTWMEIDNEDKEHIILSTRRYGNIEYEYAGDEDKQEALRIAKILDKKFPNIQTRVYTTDEWTNLDINLSGRERVTPDQLEPILKKFTTLLQNKMNDIASKISISKSRGTNVHDTFYISLKDRIDWRSQGGFGTTDWKTGKTIYKHFAFSNSGVYYPYEGGIIGYIYAKENFDFHRNMEADKIIYFDSLKDFKKRMRSFATQISKVYTKITHNLDEAEKLWKHLSLKEKRKILKKCDAEWLADVENKWHWILLHLEPFKLKKFASLMNRRKNPPCIIKPVVPNPKGNVYQWIYNKLIKVVPKEMIEKRVNGGISKKPDDSGFMDLHYDYLRNDENGNPIIALSHYWKHHSGDMIADPDMEIRVFLDYGMAEAMTYQDQFGYRKVYYPGGKYAPRAKKELNKFLNIWLRNLIQQGHKIEPLEENPSKQDWEDAIAGEGRIKEHPPLLLDSLDPLQEAEERSSNLFYSSHSFPFRSYNKDKY